MSIFNLVSGLSQPTLLEVFDKGKAFFKASLDRNINKDKKNEILNKFLNGLSESAFIEFAPMFIMQADYGFAKFGSIEMETKAIVEKFPRLKEYEAMISEKVKEDRTKKNLPL